MARQAGWYWVKLKPVDGAPPQEWFVGYYDEPRGLWMVAGFGMMFSPVFEEIDERKLVRQEPLPVIVPIQDQPNFYNPNMPNPRETEWYLQSDRQEDIDPQ